jgi:hypothetical protein
MSDSIFDSSSSSSITGFVPLDNLLNEANAYFGGQPPSLGDSLGDQRIRAAGVDPITGLLIAPQYLDAAEATGYDPNDPMGYLKSVRAAVDDEFNRQYAANQRDAGGGAVDLASLLKKALLYLFLAVVILIVIAKVL